jgi:hypothetical protein
MGVPLEGGQGDGQVRIENQCTKAQCFRTKAQPSFREGAGMSDQSCTQRIGSRSPPAG